MLDAPDIHPLFHGAPDSDRVPQAAQAHRPADPRGDRDLRHGPAGRRAGWSASPAARTATRCSRALTELNGAACCRSSCSPATSTRASRASRHILPEFLTRMGVPHRIEYRDTYSIVTDKVPEGRTYCALCSRLRRGHLYRIAREEGCSALVLGHHRGDILETFLLNLFHGGKLAAMPPKLLNDEGDVYVLRPLAHWPRPTASVRRAHGLPDHPLRPLRQPGRAAAAARSSAMLDDWETKQPGPAADPVPGADPGEPEPSARPGALRLQGAVRGPRHAAATSHAHSRPRACSQAVKLRLECARRCARRRLNDCAARRG